MGIGKSKPTDIFKGNVTRESLLKSTEPMRLLMNEAFNLMLKDLSIKDLLSLSSSSECNKYVIIMGKAFEKYFESIDLVPSLKDEDKTIYFQKVDKLTSFDKEQKQHICIALGYFFTLLFQIFAAIYFTIFDDDSIKPGYTQNIQGILPYQQQQQTGPILRRTFGGSEDDIIINNVSSQDERDWRDRFLRKPGQERQGD